MLLLKLEIKRNLKALLIWSVIMASIIVMLISMYAQYAGDQQSIAELLQSFPEPMLKIFNMDRLDYGSLIGFYAVQGYFMVTLIGSIYVVMLASSILAKEESGRTIEFLLSKPLTRSRIVGEKLLALLANIFIFNAVIAAVTWLCFRMHGGAMDGRVFLLLAVTAPLLLHLTFGSLAFVVSGAVGKGRNALSYSLGIVFAAYFFNVLAGINREYTALKYLSPFQYVNAADIVTNGRIDGTFLLIMALLTGAGITATYLVFGKKNIMA